MNQIKLIVGLGNPGPDYHKTRHNAGEWLVEQLLAQTGDKLLKEKKFHGLFNTIKIAEQTCHILVPTTFMNLCGQSVAATIRFYKLKPEEVLVVHDELDFPAGQARLKADGGHGGHNGLRDIINHLGTRSFYRLRLGIGHPGHKDRVSAYVLGCPSKKDKEAIQHSIDDALNTVSDLLQGHFEMAMRYLHND